MEWCTGNEITTVAIDGVVVPKLLLHPTRSRVLQKDKEREISPNLAHGEHPHRGQFGVFQQPEFDRL
jgi:hypothetical protein